MTNDLEQQLNAIIEKSKTIPPMTRKALAVANYQAITGLRAPDDLHESWADRVK